MNAQGGSAYGPIDYSHQHQLSQSQPPTPQTATSGGTLTTFPQPPLLQPTYQQPSYQFPFPSPNGGVASTAGQPGPMHPNQQLLPLPQASMQPGHAPLGSAGGPPPPSAGTPGAYGDNHAFDTTGQIAPPGMKPRVAATLWEDEGSLCFQVEARGVCVARREDNHMINGTKLLNVAGMTRGRRDGILKSEKVRHVVKIGPMHLKGVWIPFERALDFANKEKITHLLYPLFVHNIGAFLYHPTNTHRTNAVMAAAEQRRRDSNVLSHSQALNQGSALVRRGQSDLMTSPQPPPLHGMHNPLHTPLPPHTMGQQRPGLERSMSFPTPPSSASSVMGVGASDGGYWGNGMVPGQGNQPLAIDTVGNSRSLPTTPATTPPGGLQQLQQYPQQPSLYNQPPNMPHGMQRYNQPLPQPSQYMGRDSNMGPPPSSRPGDQSLSRPPSRQQDDVKDEGEQNVLPGEHDQHGGPGVHGPEDHGHPQGSVHDSEYPPQDSGYSHSQRYYPPLNTEHNSHLSPELTGSPSHAPNPGTPVRSTYGANVPRTIDNSVGATPRSATTPQGHWSSNGYSTPPSNGNSQSGGRYQLATGDNTTDNLDNSATGPAGAYGQPSGLGVTMPSQPTSQSYTGVNGTPNSNKRSRDDEEEQPSRPSSSGQEERPGEPEVGGLKRRKTISSSGAPTAGMATGSFDRNADARLNRTRSSANPARVGGRR
ncbi:apses-domain-containing protein [Ascodesmis nigricans]|uniref:Apses-domain-containing protein n=1 Tax=Ascodesmis nigricans TaxID=341454 RepID=A0A4S2MXN9_9PEZI|nr:apses-domain-containing protein [Ascodesmis nigricans]